eukprot:3941679-Rhodomonas_salina.2
MYTTTCAYALSVPREDAYSRRGTSRREAPTHTSGTHRGRMIGRYTPMAVSTRPVTGSERYELTSACSPHTLAQYRENA